MRDKLRSDDMRVPSTALCIDSHKALPHFCVGLVDGGVAVAASPFVADPSIIEVKGSVRATAYCRNDLTSAAPIYAASDTGKLHCLSPGRRSLLSTHEAPSTQAPLSALLSLGSNIVVAGDDDGGVHLFDIRNANPKPAASLLEQGDYVSAIQRYGDFGLAVAAGDGTLCVYDMRLNPSPKLKLVAATPSFDDDLLSLALTNLDTRAVGGTLSGAINVYNMKLAEADEDEPDMNRFVDRFYGHPESVSALVALEEPGVVLTGSSDGIVRVIDPQRKTFLGVLPFLGKNVSGGSRQQGSRFQRSRSGQSRSDESGCDPAGRKNCQINRTVVKHCTGSKRSHEEEEEEEKDIKSDHDAEEDEIYEEVSDGSDEKGADGRNSSSSNSECSTGSSATQNERALWPIEGLAIIRGSDCNLLGVIGHNQFVRFCDCSILNDNSDDEGESAGTILRDNMEYPNVSSRRDGAAAFSSLRGKRRKKEKLPDDEAKSSFFADL